MKKLFIIKSKFNAVAVSICNFKVSYSASVA